MYNIYYICMVSVIIDFITENMEQMQQIFRRGKVHIYIYHMYRFIGMLLTKAAYCRILEIVRHLTALSYTCIYTVEPRMSNTSEFGQKI